MCVCVYTCVCVRAIKRSRCEFAPLKSRQHKRLHCISKYSIMNRLSPPPSLSLSLFCTLYLALAVYLLMCAYPSVSLLLAFQMQGHRQASASTSESNNPKSKTQRPGPSVEHPAPGTLYLGQISVSVSLSTPVSLSVSVPRCGGQGGGSTKLLPFACERRATKGKVNTQSFHSVREHILSVSDMCILNSCIHYRSTSPHLQPSPAPALGSLARCVNSLKIACLVK